MPRDGDIEKEGWSVPLLAFFMAFLILASRQPDALLRPQFFAEDGLWYAQGHERGAASVLLDPQRGYAIVLPRLCAAVALQAPLRRAPLVLAVLALLVDALPVLWLASSRFERPLPSVSARLLASLVYVALPGMQEMPANVTNAIWPLATVACLAVIGEPRRSFLWQCAELRAAVRGSEAGRRGADHGPARLDVRPHAPVSASAVGATPPIRAAGQGSCGRRRRRSAWSSPSRPPWSAA